MFSANACRFSLNFVAGGSSRCTAMINFDFSNPILSRFGEDRAMRITHAPSRSAWRLAQCDHEYLERRLRQLGPWARVSDLARAVGWSKPTVMKFVRIGLLQRRHKQRGQRVKVPIQVSTQSVIALAAACQVMLEDPPCSSRDYHRVRARFEVLGPNGDYDTLPPFLTVGDTARYLRCTHTTVLRMIRSGEISANHRTPCRWEIRKKDLPWWSRGKNELGPLT
jgi:hypothetical protein